MRFSVLREEELLPVKTLQKGLVTSTVAKTIISKASQPVSHSFLKRRL